jgi:hypothetical protein
VFRHATHGEQLCQRVDDIFARDTSITLQSQTLSRVLIDNTQPLQWTPFRRLVENEVPRPNVVFVLGSLPVAAILALAESSLLSLLYRYFQPLSSPQSEHSRENPRARNSAAIRR